MSGLIIDLDAMRLDVPGQWQRPITVNNDPRPGIVVRRRSVTKRQPTGHSQIVSAHLTPWLHRHGFKRDQGDALLYVHPNGTHIQFHDTGKMNSSRYTCGTESGYGKTLLKLLERLAPIK